MGVPGGTVAGSSDSGTSPGKKIAAICLHNTPYQPQKNAELLASQHTSAHWKCMDGQKSGVRWQDRGVRANMEDRSTAFV